MKENNGKRLTKSTIIKICIGIVVLLLIFNLILNNIAKKGEEAMNVKNELVLDEMGNAIRIFYIKTGQYPDLVNKENSLNTVTSPDGNYVFTQFTRYDKMPVAEIVSGSDAEVSNKISGIKDNKGGWYYSQIRGVIEYNFPVKNSSKEK